MKRIWLLAVSATLIVGIAVAGVSYDLQDPKQTQVTIESVEIKDKACLNNTGGHDTLPETAASEPQENGRKVTIQYVIPVNTQDANLSAELNRVSKDDGRPLYNLTVKSSEGAESSDCDFGLLYNIELSISDESPYKVNIYHNGELEGYVSRTESGFATSSTEKGPNR
ncbi:hypothetical protein ACH9L7_18445 (plasmid) [Haloferax sp. S1W]|uniref:hypothetical protein n=1 Tax=Haloferax sp. S1W TaxID=3377110 RepID=UPI0037C6931D